jgi:hypothetical protein
MVDACTFLELDPRTLLEYNGTEMHVCIADINVSSVGLLFKKDLNHDPYFVRSRAQATQIKSPLFKPFLGSSKLHKLVLKNSRKFVIYPLSFELLTIKFSSQNAINSAKVTPMLALSLLN